MVAQQRLRLLLNNKKRTKKNEENLFKQPLIVIGDSSPQTTLCAV